MKLTKKLPKTKRFAMRMTERDERMVEELANLFECSAATAVLSAVWKMHGELVKDGAFGHLMVRTNPDGSQVEFSNRQLRTRAHQ